jgi:hypothetical protein
MDMDNRDLIHQIRKAFPLKKEDELKQAQDKFVSAYKKLLQEDQRENYFKIYGNSPNLYKFENEK